MNNQQLTTEVRELELQFKARATRYIEEGYRVPNELFEAICHIQHVSIVMRGWEDSVNIRWKDVPPKAD